MINELLFNNIFLTILLFGMEIDHDVSEPLDRLISAIRSLAIPFTLETLPATNIVFDRTAMELTDPRILGAHVKMDPVEDMNAAHLFRDRP